MIVYRITNEVNGKTYIGITTRPTPAARFADHKGLARCGSPRPLYTAMREHGFENFKVEAIASGRTIDELYEIEIRLIAAQPCGSHYNACRGGRGINDIPAESRRRIGAASSIRMKARHRAQQAQKENVVTQPAPAPISTPAQLAAAIALLKQRGVTQVQIAADLGRTQTTVSQWKHGKQTMPGYVGAYLRDRHAITAAPLPVPAVAA